MTAMNESGFDPVHLKNLLEECIKQYPARTFLYSDPVQIPHNYIHKQDIEITALICALFSYGRVTSILNFLNRLLEPFGSRPVHSLRKTAIALQNQTLNWKDLYTAAPYRFQNARDISALIAGLSHLIVESEFPRFEPASGNTSEKIMQVQQRLYRSVEIQTNGYTSAGLRHLIGIPAARGAAKRLCMFFRWMVRTEYPDFGIYKKTNPADLIMPLDVHISRISRNLQLTGRKTADRKTSIEVTNSFRRISADDPLRYDFFLTRTGILGHCKGSYIERLCETCRFRYHCSQYTSKSLCQPSAPLKS